MKAVSEILDESEVMKLYDASRVNSTVPSAMYFFNGEWRRKLMPSPSAFSKFVLSALKFLGILKFLRCTQNSFGILK